MRFMRAAGGDGACPHVDNASKRHLAPSCTPSMHNDVSPVSSKVTESPAALDGSYESCWPCDFPGLANTTWRFVFSYLCSPTQFKALVGALGSFVIGARS